MNLELKSVNLFNFGKNPPKLDFKELFKSLSKAAIYVEKANFDKANFEGANLQWTILEGKDLINLTKDLNSGSNK